MPSRFELPLVTSLELDRPLAPLRALAGLPYAFMLHSSIAETPGETSRRARWSFFGADPFAVFRGGDHLAAIEAFRRMAARAPAGTEHEWTGAPFTGGAVGYWSYDYGRRLERLPSTAYDDLGLPDFVFAMYDVMGAFDHEQRTTWLFSTGLPFEGSEAMQRARERLDQFRARLLGGARGAPPIERPGAPPFAASTFTPDAYRRAVEGVRECIRRGDIFQANLSQRWKLPLAGARWHAPALYESLAQRSPAPYGAYLGLGDHAVMSASPERFLELREGLVETRPIKGTRPRGATPEEDVKLAVELSASTKDRAENVMIVDVLRNDLGRVCESGSVETPEVCAIERFPQVWHLTSTVTGRLRQGVDAFDLLHACFPGGSITGAPKIRAMEILEQMEPVRRHVYTGSIGYVDWSGDADWNIAIRTALAVEDAIVFHAGGGITADSDPDAEWLEVLAKAEGVRLALAAALGEFALVSDAAAARR